MVTKIIFTLYPYKLSSTRISVFIPGTPWDHTCTHPVSSTVKRFKCSIPVLPRINNHVLITNLTLPEDPIMRARELVTTWKHSFMFKVLANERQVCHHLDSYQPYDFCISTSWPVYIESICIWDKGGALSIIAYLCTTTESSTQIPLFVDLRNIAQL